ncbi:MAG TPA: hypothetical protein VFP84_30060 [Kofleriaceae bacterium]|nr:hypothetical protein [Kofleriaceae bacterium]
MLAAGDFAAVEQCSCGSVHVTIGAVTLRLQASAIAPLAAALGEAARTLTFEQALHTAGAPRSFVA